MSLDKSEIFYDYDAFSPTDPRVIYASVTLSLSHHGQFTIQIDDGDRLLDTTKIANGARVLISFGKTQATLLTHLSGMIRSTGYERGCGENLLYTVSGFGTGIRLNERILDVLMDEPRLLDGSTVDTTDPDYAANKVVDDAFDDADYYPRSIYPSEVEGSGGYEFINSSGTTVDSPIHDFIPGVVLRFGEIEDLMRQIEDYTGGRVYVDEQDRIQLQPIKTPLSVNNGFKITTDVNLTSDLGANTLYIDQDSDYSFSEAIDKSAGYSNSLFGILPASVVPDVDSSGDSLYLENKTVEIAFKFKPITNPHWRLYAGVEAIGMDNVSDENTVRTRWRVCQDDNGVPMDTGGIIANRYMYPNQEYNTADGGLQVINIFGRGSNDLDENTWYWLILSSTNATATEYWRWYYNDDENYTTTYATASPGTSDANDGGTGWNLGSKRKFSLFQGRFKAEPYNILDVLGVRKRVLIESVTPSFPQQIRSKQAATKYLCGLVFYSSRPRRVYDFPNLTMPNNPVFPGDVCNIVDSRLDFTTPGNRAIGGQITDVTYSFGVRGAGSGRDSKGQSSLSLGVVEFPGAY